MTGRVGYSRGPFLFAEGAGLSLRVRELAQEVPDAVAEVRGGAGIHAGLFVPAPASRVATQSERKAIVGSTLPAIADREHTLGDRVRLQASPSTISSMIPATVERCAVT